MFVKSIVTKKKIKQKYERSQVGVMLQYLFGGILKFD